MFSPKKRKVVAMHNATLLKIDLIRGIESEEPTTSQHVSRLMANEDKLHKESELPDFAAVLRDNIDVLTTNQKLWDLLSTANISNMHPFSKRLATIMCLTYIHANQPEPFVETALMRQNVENGIRISKDGIHFFNFPIGPDVKPLQKGMELMIKYTETDSFIVRVNCVEYDRAILVGQVPDDILEVLFEDDDDEDGEKELSAETFICRTSAENSFFSSLIVSSMKNILSGLLDEFVTLEPKCSKSADHFMHIKFQEAQFFQNWTELSSEQARGLHSMCRPIRGNAPFILSGAPNTGKTRTVAFQIAYLLKIEVGVPFLVCAPDNNAIEKLMCALRDVLEEDVFNNQIIRLNNTETSPQTWLRHCIISTLQMATTYFEEQKAVPLFTDIIVEDINRFCEVEMWLQLSTLVNSKTNLVFTGDPEEHQTMYFMNIPYKFTKPHQNPFVRYSKSGYLKDMRLGDVFTESYSTNQKIMKFLSSIFYDNQLTSRLHPIKEYENWSSLPTKGFPIMFVSTSKGKSLFGPLSYRNELEARIVLKYIRLITDLVVNTHIHYRRQGYTNVEKDSIGIVTPYIYQTRLIRDIMALDGREFCIEDFEGGSRKAILISLTLHDRAPEDADEMLRKALSQTKHLLIIVGNHKIVSHLPAWKKLIDECTKNNAFIYSDQTADPENITSLLN